MIVGGGPYLCHRRGLPALRLRDGGRSYVHAQLDIVSNISAREINQANRHYKQITLLCSGDRGCDLTTGAIAVEEAHVVNDKAFTLAHPNPELPALPVDFPSVYSKARTFGLCD